MRQRRNARQTVAVGLLAVCLSGALAGCSGAGSATQSSHSASAKSHSTSKATSKATDAPVLITGGTAKANLAYFNYVNKRLITKLGTPHGRDFIDSLVAAGFTKADMQVTPDTTSVGLTADNIQFSVSFAGACLIGQYGDVGYVGIVATELGTGGCLIGKTRPIDW